MWRIEVDNVDKTEYVDREGGEPKIELTINERATASFVFRDYIPDPRAEVMIYAKDGTTPILGGIIFERQTAYVLGHTYTKVEIADWSIYFDWRYVSGGYVGNEIEIQSSSPGSDTTITTKVPHGLADTDTVYIKDHNSTPPLNGTYDVKSVVNSTSFTIENATTGGGNSGTVQRTTVVNLKRILTDLVTYYVSPYGITLDSNQPDGPTGSSPGLTWTRKRISEVLRDLSVLSKGYIWSISPDKKLLMVLPGTVSAPFSISGNSGNWVSVEWKDSNDKYANTVTIECGGSGTKEVTDTFTVEEGMTFYQTGARSTPTGGVSVTVNGVVKTIGPPGSGRELIWDWQTHTLTVGTLVPEVGDVIRLTYTGVFPFAYTLSEAEDDDNQILEVLIQASDVTDINVAADMAEGLMEIYHQNAKEVTVVTRNDGLRPGQTLTINLGDSHGLVANVLITDVEIMLDDDDNWVYTVKGIAGQYQGAPLDYYRQLQGRGQVVSGTPASTFSPGVAPDVISGINVFLGGSRNTALAPNPAAWTPVVDYVTYVPSVSFDGTVYVELFARTGGVGVTARLWDATDGVEVGQSDKVTSTTPVLKSFLVNITAGHQYRLEIISDTNGASVCGIGVLGL